MFGHLPSRETAVDACARAIREKILGGDIAAGARLPPERQLAERFAVNRVTVRGALAQLAKERLLSVRQGSGYVVQDFRRRGGPELIGDLAALAESPAALAEVVADLLYVRRHLARAVLERIAARRPSRKAIAEVARAVDAFAGVIAAGGSLEAIAEADLAIVDALLRATGSTVLGLCMNPVARIVSALPALRQTIYAEPAGNLVSWRAMCEWLADPARAPGDVATILDALERRDAASVARIKRRSRS